MSPLLVLAFIILAVAMNKAAVEKAAGRRKKLKQLAIDIGFTFTKRESPILSDTFKHFTTFSQGHDRLAYNTLAGKMTIGGKDFRARIGDYKYSVTSNNGKTTSTTTHHLSYLILRLPFIDVPDTIVRTESIFDKIGAAIGFDDIDFESSEFSRKFFVKGKNRQFTYGLIHQGMMEFFLTEPFTPIEIKSGDCLICDGYSRWSATEIMEKIDFAKGFIERWPADLLDDVLNRS
jgi:hypothetical protein